LEPMKIDPWLSPHITVSVSIIPISDNNDCSQVICRHVSDSAMYSASVDDNATVFCARDCQHIIVFASLIMYPVTERRLISSDAQSESVYAIKPLLVAPSYIKE